MVGGYAGMMMAQRPNNGAPGAVLITLLKAEAIKVLVIAMLLLITFKYYQGLVPLSLIGGLAGSALASGAGLRAVNNENDEVGSVMSTEEHALTASSYIEHHLSFNVRQVAEGGFWSVNFDTLVVSGLLGLITFGLLWWVVRGATAGVPTKRQAFVELLVEFIDDQVKGIFHGDRKAFVAPLALTVFVWVLVMNSMDFLPIDIMAWVYHHVFGQEKFRAVPTSDINTTFALALSVWLTDDFLQYQSQRLGWLDT